MKKYNDTGKKSFVHRANRNRKEESDIPDKFKVIYILKRRFGLSCITGEALEIPGKQYARYPDIFVKNHNPSLAILLHGGWHGYGEIKRDYDVKAEVDYALLSGVKLIEIYAYQTDNYEEEAIVQHMQEMSRGEGDNTLEMRKEVYNLEEKKKEIDAEIALLKKHTLKYCRHPKEYLKHSSFGCSSRGNYSTSIVCSLCGEISHPKIPLDPDWDDNDY